eukprot:jgi/Orpsp1_1/1176691/evm.model.c7180000058627.1
MKIQILNLLIIIVVSIFSIVASESINDCILLNDFMNKDFTIDCCDGVKVKCVNGYINELS